jgi:Arc/MetJ-type ribon-helix-helix transcriptional regulator
MNPSVLKFKVPKEWTKELDDLVSKSRYLNRSDALRAALRLLLEKERERV